MTFSWLGNYGYLFVSGVITTFWLMLFSGILGFALAVAIGVGRVSPKWYVNGPCFAFTSVIRGTPLLVQIFILYYGLGSLFAATPAIRQTLTWLGIWPYLRDGFWYVVLALTLSVGGYVGEVVRGALLSVPRGEMEAGRAYGFRGLKLLRRIWLPRALQTMMPTLAGETVLLLKATALASTVAVVDLLGAANIVRAQTFRVYEPLIFVAVGYYLATLGIERVFRVMERRMAKAYRPA
jgi:polar amino acid transport system permease protein